MSFFWGTWPKNVFLDGYSCDVIGSFKKGQKAEGQKAFDTILYNPAQPQYPVAFHRVFLIKMEKIIEVINLQ